jgi:hypothetical protein
MKLESPSFSNNGSIPEKYTCDGEDMIPPLKISDVPAGTKSLVIIMDDPDAPAGTWDHWIVFNIPTDTGEVREGVEPTGIQGMTSFKRTGYGGPCPPDREHRYFFRLYALDIMLSLPEGSTKKEILTAMSGHVIEESELIGLYNRK